MNLGGGARLVLAGLLTAVALPMLLVIMLVGSDDQADAGGQAGVDATKIPALARQMLPAIQAQLATECPQLPPVWVVAQVMAESSWNPRAWTDDSNGGTAGLYQINAVEWQQLGGATWQVPGHTRPPAGNNVWDPATHLRLGIRLVCSHLHAMSVYLARTGKDLPALDAMLVCHIAGCGRVTGSTRGIPAIGEAGCDNTCVRLITDYLTNVHRYVQEFTASAAAGSTGNAGPLPPGVDISQIAAPGPFAGASSGCTVDDPTSSGCLTAATAWALNQIATAFGGIKGGPVITSTGCWDPHLQNPNSDHPKGKACDFFPGPAGQFAHGQDLIHGWQLAAWLRAHATALHVHYIIWQGRYWDPSVTDQGGWGVPYDGGGVYDVHDPTGGHYDHVHLSVAD
jgi:hypothetical protein